MPSKGHGARARSVATRSHTYRDVDGTVLPRASFAGEPEAHQAAGRVFNLTGRRYSAYACMDPYCDAWHIRPCRRRRWDLARPA